MNTRMTALDIDRLTWMMRFIRMGNADESALFTGALTNEIGVMFLMGEKKAEPILAELLEHENRGVVKLAYFFLTERKSELKPETLELFKHLEDILPW